MKSTITTQGTGVAVSGSSVSPVSTPPSQTITVTTVGGSSLDLSALGAPGGANFIGVDMADDDPTPGSAEEQFIILASYKQALKFASPNQVTFSVDTSGNLVFGLPQDIGQGSSPTFLDVALRKALAQHLVGQLPASGQPHVLAWGTGAGADQTPTAVTVAGHDIFTRISFTTSASPASGQVIAQVAFAQQFDTAPQVIPFGLNAQARAMLNFAGSGATGPAVSAVSTGGFNFSAVAALAANTAYAFGFLIIG